MRRIWRATCSKVGADVRQRERLVIAPCAIFLVACAPKSLVDLHVPGGDRERGRAALIDLQCGVCHVIPHVPGAIGQVGPPLSSFARRVYIAGKFPNTPEVLVRFIPNAPDMAPETGMPAIAMPDAQARDIAAYLYSLN